MRKAIMRPRRPSPSMVVAMVALAIAIGGTSYAAVRLPANSVSSKQLKKNAVTRSKIKNNAVNASKIAAGGVTGSDVDEASLGTVPSARQAENATNAAHANAAAAIDRLTYKSVSGSVGPAPNDTTSSHAVATALCDQGQHVVGGGAQVADVDNTALIDSFPDGSGTAWTARVDNGDTTASHGFTVFAICTTAVAAG